MGKETLQSAQMLNLHYMEGIFSFVFSCCQCFGVAIMDNRPGSVKMKKVWVSLHLCLRLAAQDYDKMEECAESLVLLH